MNKKKKKKKDLNKKLLYIFNYVKKMCHTYTPGAAISRHASTAPI